MATAELEKLEAAIQIEETVEKIKRGAAGTTTIQQALGGNMRHLHFLPPAIDRAGASTTAFRSDTLRETAI